MRHIYVSKLFAARARLVAMLPKRACSLLIIVASILMLAVPSRAQEDNARRILKAMTSYLAGQTVISATFDSDIEVITPALQKIQFTNSGAITIKRPDHLFATRAGGYSHVDMVFDGTTATILGRHNNTYAQVKSSGTIDDLIHRLRDEFGVSTLGADLLLAGAYDELIGDATQVSYIGHGVIDGRDCDHLAIRSQEVDSQLWVEIGPNPIPRKFVITSKTVAGAPQYTLRIKSMTTNAPSNLDTFTVAVPAGATLVDVNSLIDLDEVPSGIVAGTVQ